FAENNYDVRNSQAERLAKAVFDKPKINDQRQGDITVNGTTYSLVTVPTRRLSYYTASDKEGNTWYIDNESGNPLTHIAANGQITNFDEFDDLGRPVTITDQESQNKLTFVYDNGTLDTIRYKNELNPEDLEDDALSGFLEILLSRVVDGTPDSDIPIPNWI